MNAQRFPWMKLLFSLIVVVSAILACDIHQHGSFGSSKTAEFMKSAGVLAICEQAWGKITIYTGKALKWLEVNIPIYNSWLCQTFGPYLELFWEQLFTLCVYLWDSTLFIRSWANTNIPPVMKQISDKLPGYAQTLSISMEGVIMNLVTFLHSVLKSTEYYSSAVIAWIHKNVLTGSLSAENLQKFAGNAVDAFQKYTMTTYNWISDSIAAVYAER